MFGEIVGLVAGHVAALINQGKLPMETNPSLIAFNARAKALDLADPYMTPSGQWKGSHSIPATVYQNYAMGYDATPYEWIATK